MPSIGQALFMVVKAGFAMPILETMQDSASLTSLALRLLFGDDEQLLRLLLTTTTTLNPGSDQD